MMNRTDNLAAFLRHGTADDDCYRIARRLVAIVEDHERDPAGGDPRLVGLVDELARLGSYLPTA